MSGFMKTLVSQDVTLLTGTIRDNLDPFGDHTDMECNGMPLSPFHVFERALTNVKMS